MELKTARLTLLIDPNKKAALERLCAQQDRTASQVVRQLIRDYLALHGVQYTDSGLIDDASADENPSARADPVPRRAPPASAKLQTRRRKA
jgi:hypothetical protein